MTGWPSVGGGDGKVVSVNFRQDYSVADLRTKFEKEDRARREQTTLEGWA